MLWLVFTQTCTSSSMEMVGIPRGLTLIPHPDPQAVILCRRQKLHRMEIRVRPHDL